MKINFKMYKDEDIVFVIQELYKEHKKMFFWSCEDCNRSYCHEDLDCLHVSSTESFVCKTCGSSVKMSMQDPNFNYYIPGTDSEFKTMWLNELNKRYMPKIKTRVQKNDDHFQVASEAYWKAIKTYSRDFLGKVKFNTYFWRVINNRLMDEIRLQMSTKKNPYVVCRVCGHQVGKITAEHLMNVSGKYKDGINEEFMGHQQFLDEISQEFLAGKDLKSFLRQRVVSEYEYIFPNSIMKGRNLSIDTSNEHDDENLKLENILYDSNTNDVVIDEGVYVFNDIAFDDNDVEYLKDNYPTLFNNVSYNKKMFNIGRSHSGLEDHRNFDSIVQQISKCVLKDFCETDRGYTRRDKFFYEDGQINYDNLRIFYDVIDLHLAQSYSYEDICSYVGHDNLAKEDIKSILKILGKSPQIKSLAFDYA